MNKKRSMIFRAAALLVLLAIAGLMFIIGRGHSVYLDNKEMEYEGKTYGCPYKVEVTVNGEQVAKLYEKDRGVASWMGQNFKMTLEITETKGGQSTIREVSVKLPQNMDGIVLNLPALLAGLPEEAYLTEFVSAIPEPEPEEIPEGELGIEELPTDF